MAATIKVEAGVGLIGTTVEVEVGVEVEGDWEQPIATAKTKAMAITIAIAGFETIWRTLISTHGPN